MSTTAAITSAARSGCCSTSLSSCYCSSPRNGLFWQANNIGVQCLNNGDYVQAFNCFRSALVHCKAGLDDILQQRDEIRPEGSNPPPLQQQHTSSLTRGYCVEGGCIRHAIVTPENSPFGESSTSLMVHARAIPMVATAIVNNDEGCPGYYFFSTDPFQEKNICSAVIVFNLGLVFHL